MFEVRSSKFDVRSSTVFLGFLLILVSSCLIDSRVANAASPGSRLSYADLLQFGVTIEDETLRTARALEAWDQWWRYQAYDSEIRLPLTGWKSLSAWSVAGGGRGYARVTGSYEPGSGGQAAFIDLAGPLFDISGGATVHVKNAGKLTVCTELNAGLRFLPVADEPSSLEFQAPLLVPLRLRTSTPVVVSPLLLTRISRDAEKTSIRLDTGLAAGLFWRHRSGLTTLQARLSMPLMERVKQSDEAGQWGAWEATSFDIGEGAATLNMGHLEYLRKPEYRLRFQFSAGGSRYDQSMAIDSEFASVPEASETTLYRGVQAEARAGGVADVTPRFRLGADLLFSLGTGGAEGEDFSEWFRGAGMMVWAGMHGRLLEVMGTFNLSRVEATTFEEPLRTRRTDASGELHVGVRY